MSGGAGGAGVIIFAPSDRHVITADDPQSEVIAFVGISFLAQNALETETVALVLAYALLTEYFRTATTQQASNNF